MVVEGWRRQKGGRQGTGTAVGEVALLDRAHGAAGGGARGRRRRQMGGERMGHESHCRFGRGGVDDR